jgi:hypothetical protein
VNENNAQGSANLGVLNMHRDDQWSGAKLKSFSTNTAAFVTCMALNLSGKWAGNQRRESYNKRLRQACSSLFLFAAKAEFSAQLTFWQRS